MIPIVLAITLRLPQPGVRVRTPTPIPAQTTDRWLSADKAKHFAMGAFVQGVGYGVGRGAGLDRNAAFIPATIGAIGVAGWKEWRDRNGRGTVSAKDFTWTLTGAAAVTPLLAQTKR